VSAACDHWPWHGGPCTDASRKVDRDMIRRYFTPGPGRRARQGALIVLMSVLAVILATTACSTSARTSTPASKATPTAATQAHNALYVITTNSAPSGPTSATVSALSLSDGTQLWQNKLSAQSVSEVSGGSRLYLATVTLQPGTPEQGIPPTPQGVLQAVNASTGATLWSHTPSSGLEEPLAASSDIVFAVDLSFTNPQSPPTQTLRALRGSDGTTLWSDAQRGMLGSNATVGEGALYVISGANPTVTSPTPPYSLLALNTGTGMPLWHLTLPGHPTENAAPILSSGVLYVPVENDTSSGSTLIILAVRASDGTALWHTTPVAGTTTGLVVSGGTVCYYLQPNSPTGSIVALHAADGSPSWQVPTSGNGPFPLVADGTAIYALAWSTTKTQSSFSATTTLLAFDAGTGRSLLSKPFPSLPVQAMYGLGSSPQPEVVSGVLFAIGQAVPTAPGAPGSGSIAVALNTRDASLVWQHQISGNVVQAIFAAP
jgi:outer membrane protein assembly factor BamB